MKEKNNGRQMYFVSAENVDKYNARGAKLFAEYMGAMMYEGVGYVSVYGSLGNGFWEWSESNYTMIAANLEALVNDESVSNIVMLINSPGGMAEGLFDLCERISRADEKKPVYAYITGMACSAAYAIATACRRVYAETDASTGCCGCYAEAYELKEEALESMGWLHKIFRSANAPKKNLSVVSNEEAQKAYQESIDNHGKAYLELCSSNRGISYDEASVTFGQGAVVGAEYAIDNGMIDRICSLEDALAEIMGEPTEASESTPTLNPEGEGEEDMDITTMSAEAIMQAMSDEQKKQMFDALCNANPSLIEEREEAAKKAEMERLEGLNALRNGTTEVDAVIDSAIADGKDANAIALDVIKAMKESKPKTEDTRKEALESLLDATTDAGVPREDSADGANPFLAAAEKLNESKEE